MSTKPKIIRKAEWIARIRAFTKGRSFTLEEIHDFFVLTFTIERMRREPLVADLIEREIEVMTRKLSKLLNRKDFMMTSDHIFAALTALKAHGKVLSNEPWSLTPAEALRDLLADLRHWCDGQGLDFAKEDRLAYELYIKEVNDARRTLVQK